MATKTLATLEHVGSRRTHTGGKQQKYILDDRRRRLIEDFYDSSSERTDELQRLMPGIPRWKISDWAVQLGVSRRYDRRWTPEETSYLEKHLYHVPFEVIAKHLNRTVTAVKSRAHRIRLYLCHVDGYTMADLMLGLGIRNHHKVERWIKLGLLKGEKLPVSDHAVAQPWRFRDKDIRDFIVAYPEEIDLRKVDKHWFIDLLAGGTVGIGRLDNPGRTQ